MDPSTSHVTDGDAADTELTEDGDIETCAGCLIGDECYADAAVNPANPCEICAVATADNAWSANTGASCDDSDLCTTDDVCNAEGRCRGEMMDCSHYDNQCAVGVCNNGQCYGEIQTDMPCNDGDAETINDQCNMMGECIGILTLCIAGRDIPADIDFGQVEINQSAQKTLTIHNPRTIDLKISELTLTGDDAAAFAIDADALALLPKTLPAGEDWDIPLTFAAGDAGSEGAKTAAVEISSNDPLGGPCTVPLEAEVVSHVLGYSLVEEPLVNDTLNFHTVLYGDTKTLTLRVTNTGSEAVGITSAIFGQNSNAAFTLNTQQIFPMTLESGASLDVPVVFTAVQIDPGRKAPQPVRQNGTLEIVTNLSETPRVFSLTGLSTMSANADVCYTINGEEGFAAAVDFGKLWVDAAARESVWVVENCGVTSWSMTDMALTAESDPAVTLTGVAFPSDGNQWVDPGESMTFTIAFDPSEAGMFTGSLPLSFSDDSLDRTITITGEGTADMNPALCLAADLLSGNVIDFGAVAVDQTMDTVVTVRNCGDGPLVIAVSQGAGSDVSFGLDTDELQTELAVGESTVFGVTYSPTEVADNSGSVAITADHGDTVTIALTGLGRVPALCVAQSGNPAFTDTPCLR